MTANVYMRPRPPEGGEELGVMAPSAFREAMEAADFGPPPWEFGRASLPTLRGMAAVFQVGRGGEDEDNPYRKIIDAVEEHEVVDVWMVY